MPIAPAVFVWRFETSALSVLAYNGIDKRGDHEENRSNYQTV